MKILITGGAGFVGSHVQQSITQIKEMKAFIEIL